MNLQLVYRYILSLSKNENGALRKKKSLQRWESNPGPLTCKVNVLSIAPRQLIFITTITFVKLIIFNTFAHEILPVDAVWSR